MVLLNTILLANVATLKTPLNTPAPAAVPLELTLPLERVYELADSIVTAPAVPPVATMAPLVVTPLPIMNTDPEVKPATPEVVIGPAVTLLLLAMRLTLPPFPVEELVFIVRFEAFRLHPAQEPSAVTVYI
jgi:hypothetical protein